MARAAGQDNTLSIIRLSEHRAWLGESPLWLHAEGAVAWVDIDGCKILQTDVESGRTAVLPISGRPSCIARLADTKFIVAAERKILRFAFDGSESLSLCDAGDGDPDLRFNDGKLDRSGTHFFVGDIFLPRNRLRSKLWRLDTDGRFGSVLEGFTTINGLCWSPDGKTSYIADSPRRSIWAYDFDPSSGDWHSGQLLLKTEGAGRPDGAAIDTDGCYWVAMFGGSAILRVSPRGSVVRVIKLPVRFPTMVAFGGTNLDLMIITTACIKDDRQHELDGCLLALETGHQGLPEPVFEFAGTNQQNARTI